MGIEYAKAMLGENYTETAIAARKKLEKKAERQFNLIYSKIKRKSENSVKLCCF